MSDSGNRADVRPSEHDRCAGCGTAVAGQWVSYRQDPDNPATVISHFGEVVTTGPPVRASDQAAGKDAGRDRQAPR